MPGNLQNGFSRDWKALEDLRLSEKDQNESKTMNTHLHILEAYGMLFRIWKDKDLEKSIRKDEKYADDWKDDQDEQ